MKTFISCLLLVIALSCKEGTESKISNADMSVAEESGQTAPITATSTNQALLENDTKPDLKIIKTASLRFETQDIQGNFNTIRKATTTHKAYIQDDNSGSDYDSNYRNVTVRIPNTYFDSFIDEISKGVKHFDKKEISAQDVTEEFVDIEARLKAKRTLENRYLEILKKANKISEILEIENELAKIREEIEAAEGRLKYLQNKVSMSTVSIEMYTKKPEGTGTTVSYGSKMWNAISSGFNGLSSFFLAILYIWPFILIFVVGFFFIRRRARNKKNK